MFWKVGKIEKVSFYTKLDKIFAWCMNLCKCARAQARKPISGKTCTYLFAWCVELWFVMVMMFGYLLGPSTLGNIYMWNHKIKK